MFEIGWTCNINVYYDNFKQILSKIICNKTTLLELVTCNFIFFLNVSYVYYTIFKFGSFTFVHSVKIDECTCPRHNSTRNIK